MHTVLTESPQRAAEFIRAGEVVAFPTETVYGLGADLYCEEAVRKIFAAKGRPSDNPLIAHIAELSELPALAAQISTTAEKLIDAFFPGPLTIVLRKAEKVPLVATAGLDTIGVRMPRHALARQFLRACETAVAAPSANLSGGPSPTTWHAVKSDLAGRISCILQAEQTRIGLESTVIDCTQPDPLVLRAGAVTLEQLRKVIPSIRFAGGESGAHKKSPGTRHRHYSPRARVRLIEHPDDAPDAASDAAYIGLSEPVKAKFKVQRICRGVAQYAHELFAFFRDCDEAGMRMIYCQKIEEHGLGLALMDRLKRAAENQGDDG